MIYYLKAGSGNACAGHGSVTDWRRAPFLLCSDIDSFGLDDPTGSILYNSK